MTSEKQVHGTCNKIRQWHLWIRINFIGLNNKVFCGLSYVDLNMCSIHKLSQLGSQIICPTADWMEVRRSIFFSTTSFLLYPRPALQSLSGICDVAVKYTFKITGRHCNYGICSFKNGWVEAYCAYCAKQVPNKLLTFWNSTTTSYKIALFFLALLYLMLNTFQQWDSIDTFSRFLY